MINSYLNLALRLIPFLLVTISLFDNCVSSPYQGLFVTNASHHIYGKQIGPQLTSAKVEKMVESCSDSNVFLYPFYYGSGDDLPKLMKEAGMTKIAVVDRRSISILFFVFYQNCVQIYGE